MSGRLRQFGAADDGAVVVNVTVAVALPFVAIVTVAPELQLASDGRPEHTGVIITGPLLVNPFCAVNVSVAVPDCPGEEIFTVVGFAEIVNVGAGPTVSVTLPTEVP
jgi:hypothetical protein